MNFLAHIYLSDNDENLIVGNFLGDFLSNKGVAALPEPIQEGVRLHRKIDTFTDQHAFVRQSTARLRPKHGKYSPVLLDVFHDYILAKNWERYSNSNLRDFTKDAYQILLAHVQLMPDFLRQRLPLMVADDWLMRYSTPAGLNFTFSRLKLRSSHPEFFDDALSSLEENYPDLEREFNLFFPEICEFVGMAA